MAAPAVIAEAGAIGRLAVVPALGTEDVPLQIRADGVADELVGYVCETSQRDRPAEPVGSKLRTLRLDRRTAPVRAPGRFFFYV